MACQDCKDPVLIETQNTSLPVHPFTPYQLGDVDNNIDRFAEISANKWVWAYYDSNDGGVYLQVFSIDSEKVVTYGTKSKVGDLVLAQSEQPLHVTVVDSDRVAVRFISDYSGPNYPTVVMATISGTSIASFSDNPILEAYEISIQADDVDGVLAQMYIGGLHSDQAAVPALYFSAFYRPLDGSCATTTTDQLVSLRGTCGGSGNTITWDDTTCTNGGTNTVRDWQIVESTDNNGEWLKFNEYSARYGLVVWDRGGIRLRCLDTTGPTFGTTILLTSSNISPPRMGFLRLSDTLAVVFGISQGGTNYIYCWAVSRSGTTLTQGTRYEVVSTSVSIGNVDAFRISATEFGLVTDDTTVTPNCICDSFFKLSVAGTTISEDASDAEFIDSSSIVTVPDYGDSDYMLQMSLEDAMDTGNLHLVRAVDITLDDVTYMQASGGLWSKP